jgi:hypothetical protein
LYEYSFAVVWSSKTGKRACEEGHALIAKQHDGLPTSRHTPWNKDQQRRSLTMDAPLYLPAATYVQPARLPRKLDTRDTSIAELRAIPAAWAIVQKEIPTIEQRIGNEQLKPHLGNFSFRSIVQFGVVKAVDLDRIDAQLRALGEPK